MGEVCVKKLRKFQGELHQVLREIWDLVGLLGAVVALAFESSDDLETLLMYILPFTAGGFLNIALVSVVPELMEEKRPWQAFGQFLSVLSGICAMSLLTMI